MAQVALSNDEKKWQAQDDARALAQAEEIKMDSARLKRAKDEAKKIAADDIKRAQAMKKVAGQKIGSAPKKPAKKKSRGFGGASPKHNVFKKI
jgi:hypothetical protein